MSILLHPRRHTDPTWVRKTLQPCCHVHAITEDVIPVDDYVPLVYAHPKLDTLVSGHFGIAIGHPALDLDSAPQGIYHAAELDQHAVPGRLHDAASILGDLGINDGTTMGLELGKCAFFVGAH